MRSVHLTCIVLRRRALLVALAMLLVLGGAIAQSGRATLSGTVRDSTSGEELIGASIILKGATQVGAVANEYGFYSLTVEPGTYTVACIYVGFARYERVVDLREKQVLDIALTPNSVLKEVVVTEDRTVRPIDRPDIGVERLNMSSVEKMPVIFGERDVLKSLQLLPGVKSGGDGSAGLFVRGGASDQNLILFDEAPVYNPNHLLGFFSTFNTNVVKDVQLFKGSIPAEYGGRLSSVLDIRLKEGNDQRVKYSGSVGLISTNLMAEGPIMKDKASFLIAARRTYADVFLKLSPDEGTSSSQLYFYDINTKLNWDVGKKDKLFLSGYFGRDRLGFGTAFGLDWGNLTGTLRWNHIYGSRWFSNTSLIYSDYRYTVSIKSGDADFRVRSGVRDVNLSHEISYYQKPGSRFRFGFNSIHHTALPGVVTSEGSGLNDTRIQDRYGWENGLYASWDKSITDKLSIAVGTRLSVYSVLGPGDFYAFDREGNAIDTSSATGDFLKTYVNPEPRASFSYMLTKNTSLKAAYARTTQHIHLLSTSSGNNPSDQWIPNTNNVRPEIGDQVSGGWFHDLVCKENTIQLSVEAYYKWMQNQIDYRSGTELQANQLVEGDLVFGKGRAYGVEFLARKNSGRFTGWVGYTLSRTERSFAEIDQGAWFAARQDRTHDVSIVGMYELSKRVSLSALWTFQTGNAVTVPSGKYILDGDVVFAYTARNSSRLPAYHRLDLSLVLKKRPEAKFEGNWAFSIYNAYGREYPFSVAFETDPNDPSRTRALQTSLFRWVPSVSYNFSF
ncbi:MAG: TonB-dependent receptor [Flavobacteriales bacterium]|nr:TonB-dependent receptor [Flavobacteriales bacterium]